MNYRMIINTIGRVLAVETVLLLLPFVTAILYQDSSVSAFLITILITAVASIGALLVKVRNRVIYAKEGFTIVAFAWILVSIFGAIPFYISGAIPSFIDSLFETISGFTTTGASILTEIETLPKGILFWRSFTHWIGGMGVLVFVMAIVPLAGDRSIHVMRAEVPGPTMEKLVPRIKGTAKLLYSIYILLTVVEVIFLVAGKMPVFDSLVHAFGTAGTGGFSIMNASIAAYGSPYLEYVIAIFMMLFGVNFTIFFLLLAREFKLVIKNEELFWYLSYFNCHTGHNIFHYASVRRIWRGIPAVFFSGEFHYYNNGVCNGRLLSVAHGHADDFTFAYDRGSLRWLHWGRNEGFKADYLA